MKKEMIIAEARRISNSLKSSSGQEKISDEDGSGKLEKKKKVKKIDSLVQRLHRILVEISKQ